MPPSLVPADFAAHVTEAVLDEMVSTGRWVDHGGDIEDQWAGGCFDHAIERALPHLVGQPFAEVRHTADFREALRLTLVLTARDQRERLASGCSYDGLGPLKATSTVYRGVTGDELNASLGTFWSQLRDQSLHRFVDAPQGGYLLEARVGDLTIDWPGTIRSRLDLSNGQDEAEIRLVPGTPAVASARRVSLRGGRVHLGDPVTLRCSA